MSTQQAGFFFLEGRGAGMGALRESSPSCESQITCVVVVFCFLFVLFSLLEKVQISISSNFGISCKYSDNLDVIIP